MYRTFTLPIPKRHIKYSVQKRPDGFLQVNSIAPYDETEYHWAIEHHTGSWNIYRKNSWVSIIIKDEEMDEITPETVAAECFRLDEKKGLKRTGGIW